MTAAIARLLLALLLACVGAAAAADAPAAVANAAPAGLAAPADAESPGAGGAVFAPFESSSVRPRQPRPSEDDDSGGLWLTGAVALMAGWGLWRLLRQFESS